MKHFKSIYTHTKNYPRILIEQRRPIRSLPDTRQSRRRTRMILAYMHPNNFYIEKKNFPSSGIRTYMLEMIPI